MKTRTFIAVEASAEIVGRAERIIDRLAAVASGAQWVSPERMHFTLQFLGDITDQEIADVCSIVGRVADRQTPFTIDATGVGAFPAVDRPRTLWIGVGAGSDELCKLQQAVESGLEGLGFRGENRRYVPHLTIGKSGRHAAAFELVPKLGELAEYDAGSMRVEAVTVFASQLLREGPEYRVLATCPLNG